MANITALANIALRRVGIEAISSLTEGTPQASAVNDLIPEVRDAMLSEHTWRFAKKQVDLGGKSADPPLYKWKNAFILPADVLLVVEMNNHATYEVMNIGDKKMLCTDEDVAKITYRARVTEDGLWDPQFRDAFAKRLAAELALSVNENIKLASAMMELYHEAIQGAIANDSIESPEIKLLSPSILVDVRAGTGLWGSDMDHKIKTS